MATYNAWMKPDRSEIIFNTVDIIAQERANNNKPGIDWIFLYSIEAETWEAALLEHYSLMDRLFKEWLYRSFLKENINEIISALNECIKNIDENSPIDECLYKAADKLKSVATIISLAHKVENIKPEIKSSEIKKPGIIKYGNGI